MRERLRDVGFWVCGLIAELNLRLMDWLEGR